MKVTLETRAGFVYLRDQDTQHDILALTPAVAVLLSHFLQTHLISEIVVQLRLAAIAAQNSEDKSFDLKRT